MAFILGVHFLREKKKKDDSLQLNFFRAHKLSIPTSSLNIEGSRPRNELGRTEAEAVAEAVVNEMGSGRSIRFEWFRF